MCHNIIYPQLRVYFLYLDKDDTFQLIENQLNIINKRQQPFMDVYFDFQKHGLIYIPPYQIKPSRTETEFLVPIPSTGYIFF
jgi:hypothetical protein